ncbi:hypothetical protein EYR38_003345 [Pleurotus pulmonarius]|nr:hypothetical protein EYR38_003345 [Pleurotus pulmonarius]
MSTSQAHTQEPRDQPGVPAMLKYGPVQRALSIKEVLAEILLYSTCRDNTSESNARLSRVLRISAPLSFDLLDPVFSLSSLRTLKVADQPTIQLEPNDLVKIFKALLSFETLSFQHHADTSKLPLTALTAISPISPNIEELALHLDAPGLVVQFAKLRIFDVGRSPIAALAEVATLLSRILPQGTRNRVVKKYAGTTKDITTKPFEATEPLVQEVKRDMAREMKGNWIGPCPLEHFFESMNAPSEDDSSLGQPNIPATYFKDQRVTCEKDLYKSLPPLINGNSGYPSLLPNHTLVDTFNHADPNSEKGAGMRPDLSHYEHGVVLEEHPTTLDLVILAYEVKKARKEDIVNDTIKCTKPLPHDDCQAPYEKTSQISTITRGKLANYATQICRRQHRTHFYMVFIFHPFIRFIRWDRAGAIVTKRINYVKDCTPFVRFLYLFGRLDRAGKGFDPTVRPASQFEAEEAKKYLKRWEPKLERTVFKMDVPAANGKMRQFLVWERDGMARGGNNKDALVRRGRYLGSRRSQQFSFTGCQPLTEFLFDCLDLLGKWDLRYDPTIQGWEEDGYIPASHAEMEPLWRQALQSPLWPVADRAVDQVRLSKRLDFIVRGERPERKGSKRSDPRDSIQDDEDDDDDDECSPRKRRKTCHGSEAAHL